MQLNYTDNYAEYLMEKSKRSMHWHRGRNKEAQIHDNQMEIIV